MVSVLPSPLGLPLPRVDAEGKVTGAAKYTADIALPGMLWAKVLRSPWPHARIRGIDVSGAKQLPGVHAVITGADVAGFRYGRRIMDMPVLAEEVVRFVGEPVAAVAGVDEAAVDEALRYIEVDYEELPVLADPLEAMRPGAMLLHPQVETYEGLPRPLAGPTNIFVTNRWGRGDVGAGFQEADVVVENSFSTAMTHQAYFETSACLVQIDEAGTVQIWAPSKNPHQAKPLIAKAIGLSKERVRLHPVTIGGDFGAKGLPRGAPICYFLARASGRPVRMVADYVEEFQAANPRHSSRIQMRTGVKRDGAIVAHEVEIVFNSGAYGACIPGGFLPGARTAGGPYQIPNTRITARHVYTNQTPCGYMRGPGRLQASFALESQIDCVAVAVGLDPAELRRRNLITDGMPNALGETFEEVRAHEVLQAAISASGYMSPKAPGTGRGMAMAQQEAGGGETHASVALGLDGTVVLGTPIFEQGSGTYTMLRQVVAASLGLPADRVLIEVWDTDAVTNDTGISGDRGTRLGSQAAHAAAEAAKRRACMLAAESLGWPEDRVMFQGNAILRRDTGEQTPWRDVAVQFGEPILGSADIFDEAEPSVTGFSAQVAEVTVDPETGQVRLVRLTSVHDTGWIINAQGHQGQINGGVVQGIGYALMEEMTSWGGRISTLSFADYKIPTVADLPVLETMLLPSDSGTGPLHVKSIGERANTPTAAAVANAVSDACSTRIFDLPITAERVYRALRASRV